MLKRIPIPDLTADELRRFWIKVNKTGYDDSGAYHQYGGTPCWIWTAAHHPLGYGLFSVSRNGRFIQYRASRIAHRIHHGYDPGELDVCHYCDYPPCVNFEHTRPDTMSGNMQEASQKGRIRNQIIFRHFTDSEVEAIRIAIASGSSLIATAAQYDNATSEQIRRIAWGRIYKRAPGPITPPDPNWQKEERNPAAKLTESTIYELWRLYLDLKLPKTVIGERLGVSHSTVRHVVQGTIYQRASEKALSNIRNSIRGSDKNSQSEAPNSLRIA